MVRLYPKERRHRKVELLIRCPPRGSGKINFLLSSFKLICGIYSFCVGFLSKTLTGTVIEVCLNSYSCSVCGEVLGAQRGQWVFVACRKETQAMIANEVSVHNDRVSLGFCEVEVYGKANR